MKFSATSPSGSEAILLGFGRLSKSLRRQQSDGIVIGNEIRIGGLTLPIGVAEEDSSLTNRKQSFLGKSEQSIWQMAVFSPTWIFAFWRLSRTPNGIQLTLKPRRPTSSNSWVRMALSAYSKSGTDSVPGDVT
jgi:hypothetical protein